MKYFQWKFRFNSKEKHVAKTLGALHNFLEGIYLFSWSLNYPKIKTRWTQWHLRFCPGEHERKPGLSWHALGHISVFSNYDKNSCNPVIVWFDRNILSTKELFPFPFFSVSHLHFNKKFHESIQLITTRVSLSLTLFILFSRASWLKLLLNGM